MLDRLRRALDWRLRSITSRLDASQHEIASLHAQLDSLSRQLHEAVLASQQAGEEQGRGLRAALDQRVQPLLRAVVSEEAENRRRLYAARAGEAYELAYSHPNPLVSITVAARERPDLLVGRSLPSLLAQTHENIEVLVVGDAAPPQLADALATVDDARVSYFNLPHRVTASTDPATHWLVASTMARNEAARRARGHWLLHFDDDDSLRPAAVATLLEVARAQRAEVAYGGFEERGPHHSQQRGPAFPPHDDAFGWQGALVHGQLRFFERELVAADLGIPGDAYLLARMLRTGVRFALLDEIVWDYYPSTLWSASTVADASSQTSSTTSGSSSE